MSEVVSFRPTAEEAQIIERTKRRFRLRTRSEAVRHLVRVAADRDADDALDRLFAMRFPPELQSPDRSVTAQEIDEVVYGEHLRHADP